MKWIKAIITGVAATFSMDLLMIILMQLFGLMPTNIHPAAAFLFNLGIDEPVYATLLHFCYGILWAIVFVYTFEGQYTLVKALILSGILWIFMMVVYSPIIGWGFFGMGYSTLLQPDHPLYISSVSGYLLMTLSVHIMYGITLGLVSIKIFSK